METLESALQVWRTHRNNLLAFMDSYGPEKLNTVPDGFSNNLIWHLGHTLVVQQLLVYRLSGLDLHIPEDFVPKYGRGSKPGKDAPTDEIALIRDRLNATVPQLEADLRGRRFTEFRPFTNSAGFHLTNVEEAVVFNNFHEGLHLGYMLSIRKFL